MRFTLVGVVALCAWTILDLVAAFPQPGAPAVPQPARRHSRPGKRGAFEYPNPLVASRQVKADSLRNPTKAKRACPSFLPNGNCACPGTETYCSASATCVNLQTNIQNCGQCGTACPQGMGCYEGSCSQCDPDGASPDFCSGRCTNTQIDSRNCGTCGTICPTGTTCMGGGCACETTHGYAVCDNVCVNTETYLTDPDNCGACGFVCNTGTLECSGGDCMCDTANGYVSCNGNCVSSYFFTYSGNNCGSCGHVCQSPTSGCLNSECVCPQGTSYTPCGDDCYDLTSDISNCGRCGNACTPTTESCQSGVCACDASAGYSTCDNTCVLTSSFETDLNNCGQCGTVCPSGSTCQSGICTCTTAGTEICSGACIAPSACDITGYIVVANINAPTTVICVYNNDLCSGGAPTAVVASIGVSKQHISWASYPTVWVSIVAPDGGTTFSSTNADAAALESISIGPGLEAESPGPGGTIESGSNGPYETDVWTISSTSWKTSLGVGYPMSLYWYNPDGTPVQLSIIYDTTPGDLSFDVSADSAVNAADARLQFTFIPAANFS